MNVKHLLWFILALVTKSTADTNCNEMCVLEDVSCVTEGANNFFRPIAKRYDPVYIQRIDGQYDNRKLILTDIRLRGLADCNVTRLELTVPTQDYRHYVRCVKFILNLKYKIGENTRQNSLTLTAANYRILNSGQYGISVSCKDHLPHFFIQSVETQVALRDGENRNHRDMLAERIMYLVTQKVTLMVFLGINDYFERHSMSDAFPYSKNVLNDFCASNKPQYRKL